MSAFASLSLLLVASWATQDQNPLVSAEVRAASAPVAIADLSKQINVPLEAMASTKDDFLILKVEKVPLQTLLQKIADTLSAEWEKTGSGYRLVRTDQMRRKEVQEEQEKLTIKIRESFVNMKKQLQEIGDITTQKAERAAEQLMASRERQRSGVIDSGSWREEQRVQQQAPVYRIMRNLVPSIPAETLASVPRGRCVVYSTSPTRMQQRMPGDVSRYLDVFLKEQRIWSQAMKTVRDRKGGVDFYYDENGQDPSNRQVGKILLKISRSAQGQGVSVRMIVADTKGRMMANGQETMGWKWESTEAKIQEATKLGESEPSIELKGLSKELFDSFRLAFEQSMGGTREPTFNISKELKDYFINVDKNEPLALVTSDALFGIAQIKKLNVVACPSDEMIFATSVGQGKELKPSSILSLVGSLETEMENKDGWLTLKPKEPSVMRARRNDRSALANYIRRTIKEGRLSLDNKAAYAFASRKEEDDFMPVFFLTMLGLTEGLNAEYADWSTLRLYGSLTPMQLRAAKASQPIPFRSLQPAQIEIIRHMVFDRDYGSIQLSYEDEVVNEEAGEQEVIYGGGLDQEATEILPTGFTGNESLQITETLESRLFGKSDEDGQNGMRWGEQSMSVDSMAYEIFQKEKPEFFPWLAQEGMRRPNVNQFRTGNERQIAFTAKFTKRASFSTQLTEKTYNTKAPVTFDKLPAEIKKQVEDALAKIRETYKGQKPPTTTGGGGGGAPPPPPH